MDYWRRWVSRCTYEGRWREMVHRSALALKLMVYDPTGALVAAPTMGLPEWVGGVRNWDYRYTWLRDAGFTLYALIPVGFDEEARNFMGWLRDRCNAEEHDGLLQPLYGIDGRERIEEADLSHLSGYMGSRPEGLATPPTSRPSSTSTGPCWMPLTYTTSMGRRSTTICGRASTRSSTGSVGIGVKKMRGSGRSAGAGGTSSPPSS